MDKQANLLASTVCSLIGPVFQHGGIELASIVHDREAMTPAINQLNFLIRGASSDEHERPIRRLIKAIRVEGVLVKSVRIKRTKAAMRLFDYTIEVNVQKVVGRHLCHRLEEYGHGGQEKKPSYTIPASDANETRR